MSVPSKILLAGACICALVIGLFLLLLFNQDYFQETRTRDYQDRHAAEGWISNGWLPHFLPQSAVDIHEKHNMDYNTGIISFKADTNELQLLESRLQTVHSSRWQEIAPRWLYKNEPWFPRAIRKGNFRKLLLDGFNVYDAKSLMKSTNDDRDWYLAINRTNGTCYSWNLHGQ